MAAMIIFNKNFASKLINYQFSIQIFLLKPIYWNNRIVFKLKKNKMTYWEKILIKIINHCKKI